jgi:hypothetical protein
MSDKINGATPPQPGAKMPIQFNFGQVVPGVFRIQVICGITNFMCDLPTEVAAQVHAAYGAKLAEAQNKIVVVPAGVVPPRRPS